MAETRGQRHRRERRAPEAPVTTARRRTLAVKDEPWAAHCVAFAVSKKPTPVPLAPPTPENYGTTARLAYSLDAFHLSDTWLGLLPSRLGTDVAVDAASRALIYACEHTLRGQLVPRDHCAAVYNDAIWALRKSMQDPGWRFSDDALFAIAVLAFFEKIIGEGQDTCFSHREGIEAILIARMPSRLRSEVTAAMLYQARDRVFCVPVIRGLASPFDVPGMRDQAPIVRHNLSPHFATLRHVGNRVFVRLPRLIARVRAARTPDSPSQPIADALKLASELMSMLDEKAESASLHQVGIAKTADPVDAIIAPWSFQFRHVGEMKAAILYWEMHVFLARLCIKLGSLTSGRPVFDMASLRTDNFRSVTNILMSWEYAMAHSRSGTLGFTQTLVLGLWGATSDMQDHRGLDRWTLRTWMLRRFPQSMRGWPSNLSPAEMDEAADIFVGGPLEGFMVNTHAPLLY